MKPIKCVMIPVPFICPHRFRIGDDKYVCDIGAFECDDATHFPDGCWLVTSYLIESGRKHVMEIKNPVMCPHRVRVDGSHFAEYKCGVNGCCCVDNAFVTNCPLDVV